MPLLTENQFLDNFTPYNTRYEDFDLKAHKLDPKKGMPEWTCCVYEIGFVGSNKIYIGSTKNWPSRKWQHCTDLKNNRHGNLYLQRAYNKYRKDSMYITVIEYCNNPEELVSYEQKWIDNYDSSNRECGYNLVKIVGSGTRGLKLTEKQKYNIGLSSIKALRKKKEGLESEKCYLYNPSGNLIKIDNLYSYCKDNNLDYRSMIKLKDDKILQYNGWKLSLDRKHKRKFYYKFVTQDETIVQGYGLRGFCRENQLNYRNMLNVFRGTAKSSQGYRSAKLTKEEAFTRKGKNYTLINPDGKEVIINNLSAFCKKMSLNYGIIKAGGQSSKWKLKK